MKTWRIIQNGRHFSVLLFSCKLSLAASFLNSKFKRIFSLKRGSKGKRKKRILKRRLKLWQFWNKMYGSYMYNQSWSCLVISSYTVLGSLIKNIRHFSSVVTDCIYAFAVSQFYSVKMYSKRISGWMNERTNEPTNKCVFAEASGICHDNM